jgi:apolipoprotein N-acyltransferase
MRAPRLPTLSVLLAGLAQAVAVAVPGSGQPLWWLQILSLSVLAWQLRRCAGTVASWSSSTWSESPRRAPWQSDWRGAAWLGWVFATAWLCGTFWWLFISMHTYGGLAAPLAVLAVLALAAALALYYAAACAIFFKLFSANPSARWSWAAIIFSATWTLAELARGRWFTGFPWGAGGYAHTQGPLAGYAPWVGVYGIGAVAAWAAFMLPGLVSNPKGRLRRAAGLIVVVLVVPLGARWLIPSFTHSSGHLDVALLQGNIPQDQKFQPGTGVTDALRWYGAALIHSRAALTVAPETALPLLPRQLPPGYWEDLQARYRGHERAALIGIPLGNARDGYTNSVVGLKPGQTEVQRYDKHHLVPFGEFIPPFFQWFLDLMNIPLGEFQRGALAHGRSRQASALDLPANHPQAAVLLGRPGLRAAAALRHGSGRGHQRTPPPSCAPSAPSPGRPPTCSPAAAPRTAAMARTPTACSTTTSTRWCSSPRRPTSWSCTWAA